MMIDRYRDGLSAAEVAEKEDIGKGRVYELDRAIFKKLQFTKDGCFLIKTGSWLTLGFLMLFLRRGFAGLCRDRALIRSAIFML